MPDQLLQWHFRQSVLVNEGCRPSIFEHDSPPGTDMIIELGEGSLARKRFELDLGEGTA